MVGQHITAPAGSRIGAFCWLIGALLVSGIGIPTQEPFLISLGLVPLAVAAALLLSRRAPFSAQLTET